MKIEIEVPEGKTAQWVEGILTLVDDVKFKFKEGDEVRCEKHSKCFTYRIKKCEAVGGKPQYTISNSLFERIVWEDELEPHVDIKERIKKFADAVVWCENNGYESLVEDYNKMEDISLNHSSNLIAYMRLMIITCALNEGWRPKYDQYEERFYGVMFEDNQYIDTGTTAGSMTTTDSSGALAFKSRELAEYATKQFRHIYDSYAYWNEDRMAH